MHKVVAKRAGRRLDRQIDHRDLNELNNMRSNLRAATMQQQRRNQFVVKGSSRYKGVCWCERDRKWRAYIVIDRQQKSLGYFTDEKQAAAAYDDAARKYFGEFARFNFPKRAA